MNQRLILCICVILGLSAVCCTYIWCRYHRFYAVASGDHVYLVDKTCGETWYLRGTIRRQVR